MAILLTPIPKNPVKHMAFRIVTPLITRRWPALLSATPGGRTTFNDRSHSDEYGNYSTAAKEVLIFSVPE